MLEPPIIPRLGGCSSTDGILGAVYALSRDASVFLNQQHYANRPLLRVDNAGFSRR